MPYSESPGPSWAFEKDVTEHNYYEEALLLEDGLIDLTLKKICAAGMYAHQTLGMKPRHRSAVKIRKKRREMGAIVSGVDVSSIPSLPLTATEKLRISDDTANISQ